MGSAQAVGEAARSIGDWHAFADAAVSHNLLPLVAGCMERCGVLPPSDIAPRFDQALRVSAKRALIMTAELARVMRRLEAQGIPVLAFKGPVNAHTMYQDAAQRVFSDLDLLVPGKHVADAQRVLAECGYESPETPWAGKSMLDRFTEIGLDNRRNGVHIDLHWDLTPKNWFASMPSDPWTRTRIVLLGEHEIRTLGEEDTLLSLCLHGAKHGWSGMNWLVDLCSLLLRTPDLAERSLRLVKAGGAEARMVAFGVAAAAELAPELEVAVSPAIARMARELVDQALSGVATEETLPGRIRFQWKLGGNRLGMCRYLIGRAFIPGEDDWRGRFVGHRATRAVLVPMRLLRLSRNWLAAAFFYILK